MRLLTAPVTRVLCIHVLVVISVHWARSCDGAKPSCLCITHGACWSLYTVSALNLLLKAGLSCLRQVGSAVPNAVSQQGASMLESNNSKITYGREGEAHPSKIGIEINDMSFEQVSLILKFALKVCLFKFAHLKKMWFTMFALTYEWFVFSSQVCEVSAGYVLNLLRKMTKLLGSWSRTCKHVFAVPCIRFRIWIHYKGTCCWMTIHDCRSFNGLPSLNCSQLRKQASCRSWFSFVERLIIDTCLCSVCNLLLQGFLAPMTPYAAEHILLTVIIRCSVALASKK